MPSWSNEEDALLRGAVSRAGTCWAKMARDGLVPGRSAEALRRRWVEIRADRATPVVSCKMSAALPALVPGAPSRGRSLCDSWKISMNHTGVRSLNLSCDGHTCDSQV